MLLKEFMQKYLVTLRPEATVREAAQEMREKNVGCVLITNGEALKGILTDRDIACWLAYGRNPDETKVTDVMQTKLLTATPETDVFEAAKIMGTNRVRRLPVLENGHLRGIITSSDLATVLEEEVDNFFHMEEAYHH